jgi:hypothetical protein
MILMSPVDGVDQNSPVTTTYDASEYAHAAGELHAFITERLLERVAAAGARNDWAQVNEHLRSLHVLDVMYAGAKRHPDEASPALTHLRMLAMRDQDHDAYQAEWTIDHGRSSRPRLIA